MRAVRCGSIKERGKTKTDNDGCGCPSRSKHPTCCTSKHNMRGHRSSDQGAQAFPIEPLPSSPRKHDDKVNHRMKFSSQKNNHDKVNQTHESLTSPMLHQASTMPCRLGPARPAQVAQEGRVFFVLWSTSHTAPASPALVSLTPCHAHQVAVPGGLDAEGGSEQRFHRLRGLLGNLSAPRCGEDTTLQVREPLVQVLLRIEPRSGQAGERIKPRLKKISFTARVLATRSIPVFERASTPCYHAIRSALSLHTRSAAVYTKTRKTAGRKKRHTHSSSIIYSGR